MKIRIIFLFVLVQCFLNVSGQITFDKGYIIDNSGIKTKCLIKNYDWRKNPKTIQYKLSEESPVVSGSIDSIREFYVENYPRFVRAIVKIDRSSDRIESLSTTREPLWSEETLFLRELTCGKACLWIFTDDRFWFFYSTDGSDPEQLVYKRYVFDKDRIIHQNVGFRQQLKVYLQNENTKNINLNNLEYKESSLINYFKRYNSVYEENVKSDAKKPEREVLNVKIFGSLNYSRLNIIDDFVHREFDFGGKANWMGGLELEYFLPFNRNTSSILFAPTFEHYKNSKIIYDSSRSIDMLSLHFPVGGRYSLYLNDDMRFFLEVYFNPFFCINKNDGFIPGNYDTLAINEINNLIFGTGFTYKKWQVELKYHTNRELFNYYLYWGTDYTKMELSVSYKLFEIRK